MKKLTKVEEDVMMHIWDMKTCTVSQIIDRLNGPKPPHSTISSIARILEKKGFVDHVAYGRTYVYRPVVEIAQYKKNSLRSLISTYFDGSAENLVSFLVNEKEIGLGDLHELLNEEE